MGIGCNPNWRRLCAHSLATRDVAFLSRNAEQTDTNSLQFHTRSFGLRPYAFMFVKPIVYFVHKRKASLVSKSKKLSRLPCVDSGIIGALPKETGLAVSISQSASGHLCSVDKKFEVWFEREVVQMTEIGQPTH